MNVIVFILVLLIIIVCLYSILLFKMISDFDKEYAKAVKYADKHGLPPPNMGF